MSFNLASAQPLLLALLPKVTKKLNTFKVGQRVIWSYKAHAGHGQIHKVLAKVIKLGAKQIQIRVEMDNGEFIDRWVDRHKLEKLKHLS
jgi:hypothetical protein